MESNNIIHDLQSLKIKNKKKIWEPFMKKYGCNIICEVGVCRGINFKLMIAHSPQLAIAIDTWKRDGVISRNDVDFSQEELDLQYKTFENEMADKPFVKIYREYSLEVAKKFEDNYFDFIFIDADHTYSACLLDIEAWFPKVKKGGVLLGDDYRVAKLKTGVEYGVIEALETFTSEQDLTYFEMPRYGWGILKT